MNQDYIKADPWSIIEEGYSADQVKSSESLFSIGNGAMGQRANFEELYSGPSFQGSYIGGVYYPDKTKVGWWKNGYPEYFAKVLNAPSWIGIHVEINGSVLDLNTCKAVREYRRELNMKEGWHKRSFVATLPNDVDVAVEATRFLSMNYDEIGAIKYALTPLNQDTTVSVNCFLDSGIKNNDSNWDDDFWKTTAVTSEDNTAFIDAHTMKTEFKTCTYMGAELFVDDKQQSLAHTVEENDTYIAHHYEVEIAEGQQLTVYKYGGYVVGKNHPDKTVGEAAQKAVKTALSVGFDSLLEDQKKAWELIWATSDIVIEGDVKAQQGIRFNVFQLNQTYSGKDASLNIGPKGFTGEKYGGSTYWDTEAYCIPFYMATKNEEVARNLLQYRYNQLDKAIENAQKLGFNNGAALYPMVTMNGEECHNEWEITFEEIHRNGAIAFAIFNYYRYTGDYSYIPEGGLEVLIGIARFWHQRATFSKHKDAYVILGVTGPNEYENNVNNNFYTNYIAKWCIEYTVEQLQKVKDGYPDDYSRIMGVTRLKPAEVELWKAVADQMYFPYDEELQIYLQQDGFLDKELITVDELSKTQRPINQKWSWDRILRSPYIKQADTLQGFYFFEDHFDLETLERHFDFYEPFTVHESSLSPCVHSIQAAKLDRMDQAYEFYLRTSRLDLDDYNKEVEEGLHITSMAGTWMSIVEGFAGMRVKEDKLSLAPKIPAEWDSYSFKINFRHRILKVTVSKNELVLELTGDKQMSLRVNEERVVLNSGEETKIAL